MTDRQALFVGDILATGYWAAQISQISPEDTVLVLGAGPTGLCTLQCVLLENPRRVIVCERDPQRLAFVRAHYPQVLALEPEGLREAVLAHSAHGGADVVLEVAGSEDTFRLAWECARPNAVVTVVALYDRPQLLPLPDMYGKNLTFKTGGVDGCNCAQTLDLIAAGKLDTTPLITHTYPLKDIDAAYQLFESRPGGRHQGGHPALTPPQPSYDDRSLGSGRNLMDTMTLTLNHASVPAVLYGSPSPQVWLCLHGKGGRKEEAESFAQVVCPKGWQVLAIDLPGHGHGPAGRSSSPPGTLSPS